MEPHQLRDRPVVRNHGAPKAELAAQQIGKDGVAAGARNAVDRGIRIHDRRQAGIPNRRRKGLGVHLAQLTRAHLNRIPVATAFGHRIAQEMLARGHHTLPQIVGLQAAHIGRAKRS